MGTVFLGPQRNGRAPNECSFSQAKRRLLVHTAMKESNHWRWIYEWFKRQNRVGDTFLWQQWTQAQVFQNHFHWRWSSKTTWWRMTSSLLLGPLIWVIISIHSLVYGCCLHSPYIPGILQLLQKGDQVQHRDKPCSSEKGIFVLLEIHQYRNQYIFRWDKNAFSTRKWFPETLYSKPLYNTNKHPTISPEILVK